MSERLKKTPVWHKVFGVIETLALAACATGERIGFVTPPPEGTSAKSTETVFPPSTETMPASAAETATATSVEFLGQEEVLATKLSETQTLANLFAIFEEDTQIKALFTDPAGIEYSAMGIKAYMAESGKMVTYPFFSAMSETEKKGYTAMVLQPSAEEVVYQVLNRITDAEGKVGLGITQDLNHQLLEKPVMIFATGLTTDQIAKMTDEELSRINLLFLPAGLPVSPSESPLGVGRYLASLKPVEPTPEAIFVPEGFQIGELGLLRNPETGRNVLAMNPEADWQRVREGIIGGLWQANVDWYQFTGERSDALNYSSKEEFIKAALEGKVFKVGIPVRDNRTEDRIRSGISWMPGGMRLKIVEVKLGSIEVQFLDPNTFKEYTGGKAWLAEDQEAFVLRYEDEGSGNGAVLFGVNEQGQLTISVGSYYSGDMVAGGMQLGIGRFGSGLDKKYPTYFRKDGLGINADKALSLYFASMTDWMNYLPAGKSLVWKKDLSGQVIHVSTKKTTLAAGVWELNGSPCGKCWYLNPPVFIFAE